MGESDRVEEWRRLEAGPRAHADLPGGETISYNTLMVLRGAAEVGDEPGTPSAYGAATLIRFGQHHAAGLRRLYDDRFGAPSPDLTGRLRYDTQALFDLVRDVRAAGR